MKNSHILVKQLNGIARLQFSRIPFTHWSLSFEKEPTIDLQLESEIQGRQMQSATNLIISAIKKAIRRKHTLPFYKLRFKPFFKKLVLDEIEMPIERSGNLEVNIINLTRLNYSQQLKHVYVKVTLSSSAWVNAHTLDDEHLRVIMNIEIHKAKNQQLGITFKQYDSFTSDERVVVESILPNTPAKKSLLRSEDVLLSIEGRKATNLNQVEKIFKKITTTVIRLRILRKVKGYIKNDAMDDTSFKGDVPFHELPRDVPDVEDLSSMNISFSKNSDTVSMKSDSKILDSDTSAHKSISSSSTPRNSPKKLQTRPSDQNTIFPQHTTMDCPLTDFVRVNESTKFALNVEMKYVNISIHGRSATGESLLGYFNISVDNILAECCENNMEYMEKFILSPPEIIEWPNIKFSELSGFCPDICYGDILLNFKWDQASITKDRKEQNSSNFSSQEDVADELKKHNFIRTHFNRSTQCEFCGKKIWLKDAVQCKDCHMTCHKKCMTRSQSSSVCYGTLDQNEIITTLKVTDVDCQDDEEVADEALESYRGSSGEHRKSFGDMLAHGIKRVNSANSLNIPSIVSSLSTNSKSLPPTPQHSSRKPSLTNAINVNNPFLTIVQRLEDVSRDKTTMTQQEIEKIIAPIDQNLRNLDDLMELAKTSSETLYTEFDMEIRINKINDLVNIEYSRLYSTLYTYTFDIKTN